MALMDEAVWRGKVPWGGWAGGGGGDAPVIEPATGAELGRTGTANLDASTDTGWVTIRGGIAQYPF